ncbi:MAG: sulfatase-like hydrolase/transferase [Phycisphaerales bacterium]|nr:sulfatase-like hydrolase/transferase [Phycisphaerales bacterium]
MMLAALALLAGAGAVDETAVTPTPPNVIVIVCDDAGWADFGFQGSEEPVTPNLDALAASGTRFTRGYVTASVCSPSRAGLISGRYQQRFGHQNNIPVGGSHGMPGDVDTLAERLQRGGYATAAVGKWHLGYEPHMRPLAQGFDRFHGQLAGSRPYTPLPDEQTRANYRQRTGDELIEHEAEHFTWVTQYFGERAAADITELAPGKPYFLYIAFTAPHTPLAADPQDLEPFAPFTGRRIVYLAMQHGLDRAVGDILAAVDASGERDNTVIWFVNDNGGATNNSSDNGELRGMKGSVFEGGVRVPMLVRWPGVTPAGSTYHHPVSTLDIAASTLASIDKATEDLDGVDLRARLQGEDVSPPHKHLFWQRGPVGAVLTDGRWKMILVGDDPPMLFDLQSPNHERATVEPIPEAVAADMTAALAQWRRDLPPAGWSSGAKWVDNQREKHRPEVQTREQERSLP